ncbi:MAG TPA: hypothetical protein VMV73_03435 [Candidatus Dormibacteraeota bacterium]|nr:hypothetical protein [Candidatus Dormibacteraeota bacterium]
MRRLLVFLALASLLLAAAAAPSALKMTGQILDYQGGYIFFTTGDAFRVARDVRFLDAKSGKPTKLRPSPRAFVRAYFDDFGKVIAFEFSPVPLPIETPSTSIEKFVIALSTPFNLPTPTPNPHATPQHYFPTYSGKLVAVTFTVQVPPNTPLNAQVYITTDASDWNAQAIAMQRVDALHFRVTRKIASGTDFRYLYTRGTLQTVERSQNGMARAPRTLLLSDADARAVGDIVWRWADDSSNGLTAQPNAIPTQFNPAPFPNLPPGVPTPHA